MKKVHITLESFVGYPYVVLYNRLKSLEKSDGLNVDDENNLVTDKGMFVTMENSPKLAYYEGKTTIKLTDDKIILPSHLIVEKQRKPSDPFKKEMRRIFRENGWD